jgi:hypothetical protein
MKKHEIKQLLSYLKCHPSEAAQLREVLNMAEPIAHNVQPDDLWLSASEAAKEVGKSSTWIRRKFNEEGLFRPARKEKRGKYLFLRTRVIADYNSYMMARSRSI